MASQLWGYSPPILKTISNNYGSMAIACVLITRFLIKHQKTCITLHQPPWSCHSWKQRCLFPVHKFIGMTSQEPWECGFRCFRFQLAGSFSFRNLGLVTGPVGAFCRVKTGIGCPFSAAMRMASTSPVRWDVSDVRNGRLASINDYSILQSSTCINWHRELSWRMQGWTTRWIWHPAPNHTWQAVCDRQKLKAQPSKS